MNTPLPTFVTDSLTLGAPLTVVLQDGTSLLCAPVTIAEDETSMAVQPWDSEAGHIDWSAEPRMVTAPDIRSAFYAGPLLHNPLLHDPCVPAKRARRFPFSLRRRAVR